MWCSHPVIYRVNGKLKCVTCGAILEEEETYPENVQNQPENTPADVGAKKSPGRKRQAKNAK